MQKEEKVGVMLLIMALLSLAVISFILPPSNAERLSNASQLDDRVYAEGLVMEKRMTGTGGHLILNIKMDVGAIDIFVHRNAGASEIDARVHKGDQIRVYGILSEFRGERQIKVQSNGGIIVP